MFGDYGKLGEVLWLADLFDLDSMLVVSNFDKQITLVPFF